MRKEFCAWLESYGQRDPRFVMLTGDLGFGAFENVRESLGRRFVNVGVSEQNMISLGAALASQGLSPMCYSIAPFAVFRPAEQIRVDVCLHNLNVKIVGNGGGYGYGIMGSTHHAIEDIAMLSSFQRMKCFVPFCQEQVAAVCDQMMSEPGPAYLRLGAGSLPAHTKLGALSALQTVTSGKDVTIVGLGPVVLNVLEAQAALGKSFDVFAVTEVSGLNLTPELAASVKRTRKLVVVEEHVQRGGIGEKLAALVLRSGIPIAHFATVHAEGYPTGRYGSQRFHQKQSGLDAGSLVTLLQPL